MKRYLNPIFPHEIAKSRLYGIWLNIVGGKHVHNLTTVKSAIAVLLPLVILAVIIAMLMTVIIAAIAAMGIGGLEGF